MKLRNFFVSAFVTLSLGGCSLGMFGSAQDKSVLEPTGYREITNSCSEVDLPGANLDVRGFRGLMRCFNSNGALDALDRLFSTLSDEQLEPIVTTLNRTILENKALLYKLEATHQTLGDRGLLDTSLYQFGRLTENEEFIASAIALLKEGYFSGGSGPALSRKPDRELLLALRKMAGKLSYTNTETAMDAALTLVTSRAFPEVQKRFRQASQSGRSLRGITDALLDHLRDFDDPAHVYVGHALISSIINGDLFAALDESIGASADELRRGIPRLEAVLRLAFSNNGRIFNGLTSLFHFTRKPLDCVGGGTRVANPALFLLGELAQVRPEDTASFLKRGNLLNLAAMTPFCRFPPQVGPGYRSLMALADMNAIQPAAEIVQAFYRIERNGDRPMARLLVDLLADTGSGTYPGAPPEDTSGIKRLTPLFAEITERDAWTDLLLLATLMEFDARERFSEFLSFLMESDPELGGASVYDILTRVILRTRPIDLYNFVRSISHFTVEDEPLVAPALSSLRSAYYSSDAHPIVDLLQRILAEAPVNERFFSTIFMISEKKEFRDSLRLVSVMAKDGRLKKLLGGLLAVFHQTAREGQVAIRHTAEPPFLPKRRHDFSALDLHPFVLAPEPSDASAACGRIDLGFSLSDHGHPDFEEHLRNVVACMNSSGNHADVETALDFLTNTRLPDGRSVFGYQIDLLGQLGLSPSQYTLLLNAWKREYDSGRFFRVLEALPFWFSRKNEPNDPAISESLLEALRSIVPTRLPALDRLGKFTSTLLRDPDFPRVLGFLERIGSSSESEHPEEYGLALPQPEDQIPEIADKVASVECERDPQRRRLRAEQIVQDYRESITNWDMIGERQRRSWHKSELRERGERIARKLGDPSQSIPQKTIISSLLDFMKFYSLSPGESPNVEKRQSPEYLARWFKDRSDDFQMIPYFFVDERGKFKKRLRLVNSLDRLELVLINSDFRAPVLRTNFGLKFLAQIAEAWGDEPNRDLWPAEIQRKYKRGTRPQTLREAYEDIARTQRLFEILMGFPKTPSCAPLSSGPSGEAAELDSAEADLLASPEIQSFFDGLTGEGRKGVQASLYNVRQVLNVIEENLPGSGHPVFDGGMTVFRDLFFQIYYSSPAKSMGPRDGDANNLSLVLWLARMGVTRQIGRLIFTHSPPDPELTQFMSGLIEASTTPQTVAFLRGVLTQPGRTLLWNTIDAISTEKDPDSAERLRRTVYRAVLLAHQLRLGPKAMSVAEPMIAQYRETLSEHVAWMVEKLRSPSLTLFLEALYRDEDLVSKEHLARMLHLGLDQPSLALDGLSLVKSVTDSPPAHAAWTRAWERLEALKQEPGYPQEAIASLIRDLLRFFAEGHLQPQDSQRTAERLRFFLAERLDSGELLTLLELAVDNPAGFNQVLSTLSRLVEDRDLDAFFGLIRRALPAQ